jgi:hypothetical protein
LQIEQSGSHREAAMRLKRAAALAAKGAAAVIALGVAGYVAYVGAAWLRYGRPRKAAAVESDDLLDRFMPRYDIVERHHIQVAAPADVTFAASMDMDLEDSAVVRAIFKGREILLGADQPGIRTHGLVATTKALGWRVLAERPGRELVMGAVTQPWKANVEFRGLPPDQFAAFNQPGFVKIASTLRADPVDATHSIALTETRAIATDRISRRRFRWYWARFSAGIVLIRELSIRLVRNEAEKRAAAAGQVRDNGAWRQTVGSL